MCKNSNKNQYGKILAILILIVIRKQQNIGTYVEVRYKIKINMAGFLSY
jgi:hypothetical protein